LNEAKRVSFLPGRDIYARSSNPNRRALELKLATLEQGTEAISFSSGQAATMSIMHSLQSGDHVIIPDDIYYGTRLMLQSLYARWGLEFDAVDMTDLEIISKAIKKNTKLNLDRNPF
jgi:cystathionine gamma-synthase